MAVTIGSQWAELERGRAVYELQILELPGGRERLGNELYQISWGGQWVYQCSHPYLAAKALIILEDMGNPHEWPGCFGDSLRRRVWALYRVVPCGRVELGCRA